MKFADLLKQNTSSTNTATLTLTSAVAGFRTLTQAMTDNELAVGDRTTFMVRDTLGNWEFSLFEIVSPGTLTRIEVRRSSNSGSPETFPSGAIVTNMPDSKWMSDLIAAADALEVASLPALTSIADAVRLLAIDTAGELRTATAAALKAYAGGTAVPVDTTAPSAPTNLNSSNVTQTSFTITFTPGTDNVSVARSEWSLNGTTWTSIGSASSFSVTDRTAATTYTVRVRTVDTSGNVSASATLNVTTQAASSTPDTQAPTWLAGSLSTSNVTSSGYTYSWPMATDDVGVDHYESSIDGGVTWTAHAANVTSRTITGRPASTTDQLRVRALDAAGNISNVLTGSVTTSAPVAAAPSAPTIGTLTAGDGTVSQAFTPGSNGGSPVTAYTLTVYRVSDNTVVTTATGASSPISATVANGLAVYGKVKATNNVGTSPESAASNNVTPVAPVANPYTSRTTTSGGSAISGATWSPTAGATWTSSTGDAYASGGTAVRVQILHNVDGTAAPNVKLVWAKVDGNGNPIRPVGVSYASTELPIGATGNGTARANGIAAGNRYGSWTAGGATSQQYYGVFGISGSLYAWASQTGLTAQSRCLAIFIEGYDEPIYHTNGTGTPLLFNIAMP